jgi:hypothetical protein
LDPPLRPLLETARTGGPDADSGSGARGLLESDAAARLGEVEIEPRGCFNVNAEAFPLVEASAPLAVTPAKHALTLLAAPPAVGARGAPSRRSMAQPWLAPFHF